MGNEISLFAQAITGICVGCVSTIISFFIFLPQLISIIRTKNTSGTALWTFIIYETNCVFWIIWSWGFFANGLTKGYGELDPIVYIWQWIPAILSNTLNPFLMTSILALKIHHLVLCKKLNVTELQLANILLGKDNHQYSIGGNPFKVKKNHPKLEIGFLLSFVIIFDVALSLICTYCFKPQQSGPQENWVWVSVINAISAVSTEFISWPQFIKFLKYKDTSGLALGWAIFVPVSGLIFFTYDLFLGLINGWYGVLFSLIFTGFIPSFGVLVIKIKTLVDAKKAKMTEIEYITKVLLPKVKIKNQSLKK